MRLVLGVDEAGYGPNMGPMVVAVSAWLIDSELDLLEGLAPFSPEFQAAPWTKRSDFVPLGDSKKIYQSGKGLSGLSFAIDFFETAMNRTPSAEGRWFDLHNLAAEDIRRVENHPWYDRSHEFKQHSSSDVLSQSTLLFAKEKLAQLGVKPVDFRVRILDEAYFNQCVTRMGNKSDVLGQMSIGLAWQVLQHTIEQHPCENIELYCDRQGGRKKYAAILTHTFQGSHRGEQVPFVVTDLESPDASVYSMTYRGVPMSIRFQVQGDSLLPPAASSMVAKWTRESLMHRLNQYWRGIVGPSLRPTAGYAVDAARFAEDIAPWVTKLGLIKNNWWRQR